MGPAESSIVLECSEIRIRGERDGPSDAVPGPHPDDVGLLEEEIHVRGGPVVDVVGDRRSRVGLTEVPVNYAIGHPDPVAAAVHTESGSGVGTVAVHLVVRDGDMIQRHHCDSADGPEATADSIVNDCSVSIHPGAVAADGHVCGTHAGPCILLVEAASMTERLVFRDLAPVQDYIGVTTVPEAATAALTLVCSLIGVVAGDDKISQRYY